MRSEKYRQLIDRLTAKTARRELGWKEGAYPGGFQVSFPNYSLAIAPGQDIDGPHVSMSIINSMGNIIDEFSEMDFAELEYRHKLFDLYQAARRQVFGVERALDEILIELEEY
jgi:hypothetical protein